MYIYDVEHGHTKRNRGDPPFKHRQFKKNGHYPCQTESRLERLLNNRKNNIFLQFYFLVFMASSLNRRTMTYFRSAKLLDDEHCRQIKQCFVIHPFSNFRQYWNYFMIFVYMGQFYTIPIDITRIYHERLMRSSYSFIILRNVLNYLSLVDIFFNFFTGYFIKNKYVTKTCLRNSKIIWHYLITFFLFDILSSLAIRNTNIVYPKNKRLNQLVFNVLHACAMFKIVRVPTVYRYCKQVYERFEASTMKYVLFRLITYSILYLQLINMVACFSAILTEHTNPDDAFVYSNNYLIFSRRRKMKVIEPINLTFVQSYQRYMYQATLLITGTAMGLRNPDSDTYQQMFLIVAWTMSKIFYWLFVAMVLQLFIASTSSKRKYVEKVCELEEYMKYMQLPPYLQRRLRIYYEFAFQRTYFREQDILDTLSGHLRQEINMHSCKKLVENVTFFKNIPTALFVRIVAGLKYEIFMINDVIAKANTTGDEMYFLASGTVAIYTRSGKEICHLDDGNHFGEIAMVMTNELRVASVVAIETCEMYRLDRVDFIHAIMPFPDLLEKMQHVAAERLEKTVLLDVSKTKS